jgi:molybdopterin/thiamine biosynthesis adenylyltransferase
MDEHARNRPWLGAELSAFLADARFLVVGAGGNGGLVTLGLAGLGAGTIVLCDPDRVEATDLNRSPMATPADIGRRKTDVIGAYLAVRFPQLRLIGVPEASPNDRVADACATATAVLGCLDNVHARLELDVLCRSAGRLLVDCGTGFTTDDAGTVIGAGGQVYLSRPGQPCLQCLGFAPTAREAGYFVAGATLPEPSSLLLNSVVSGLMLDCLLDELGRRPRPENRVTYDAVARTLTAETVIGDRDCPVCGTRSAEALAAVGR